MNVAYFYLHFVFYWNANNNANSAKWNIKCLCVSVIVFL